jgi:hypothetical protein
MQSSINNIPEERGVSMEISSLICELDDYHIADESTSSTQGRVCNAHSDISSHKTNDLLGIGCQFAQSSENRAKL